MVITGNYEPDPGSDNTVWTPCTVDPLPARVNHYPEGILADGPAKFHATTEWKGPRTGAPGPGIKSEGTAVEGNCKGAIHEDFAIVVNCIVDSPKNWEYRDSAARSLYSGRNTEGEDDIYIPICIYNTDAAPGGYLYIHPEEVKAS